MAISSHEQLELTQKKIADLELILEEMKREESPRAFAIMSKGFVAQIERMRGEIMDYLGIANPESEEARIA